MYYFFLLISVSLTVVIACIKKSFGSHSMKSVSDCIAFNIPVYLSAFLSVFAFNGGVQVFAEFSSYTLIMGILFGTFHAFWNIISILAISAGPMSLTTLIFISSMLLPTFSGYLFWNESLTGYQFVGILLMLVAMLFCIYSKKERGISMRWVFLCILGFFANGTVSILQKIHQMSLYKNEFGTLMTFAFLVSSIWMMIMLWLLSKRCGYKRSLWFRSPQVLMAVVYGLLLGIVNLLNVYCIGHLPSSVVFPIQNGGSMLLTFPVAKVIYKDKLKPVQYAGLVIGAFAILLIGNVFQ